MLLAEAAADAKQSTEADLSGPVAPESSRRHDALRLVLYKLEKLEQHLASSRRLLNDLRTLRRLMLEERTGASHPISKSA